MARKRPQIEPFRPPTPAEFDALARELRMAAGRLLGAVEDGMPPGFAFANEGRAPAGSLRDDPADDSMRTIKKCLDEVTMRYFLMELALSGDLDHRIRGRKGDAATQH